MNLFFSPAITPPSHQFDKEESGHIIRVLRLKEGDAIHLTDGKGNMFPCEITVSDPKQCKVRILSTTHTPPLLHMACISP